MRRGLLPEVNSEPEAVLVQNPTAARFLRVFEDDLAVVGTAQGTLHVLRSSSGAWNPPSSVRLDGPVRVLVGCEAGLLVRAGGEGSPTRTVVGTHCLGCSSEVKPSNAS